MATYSQSLRVQFVFALIYSFGILLCLGSRSCAFPQAATAPSGRKDLNSATLTRPGPSRDTAGVVIRHGEKIRVNVDLTLVNVTVTDPFDRLVLGLEQDNFRVFEDGVEQEVTAFSSEDIPISIGVVLDLSSSMTNKIDKALTAVNELFRTANPRDEFFVVGVSSRAEMICEFTGDLGTLQGQLAGATPAGKTALLDAIHLGLTYMRYAKNKKRALIILSDGGDNHSIHTQKEIKLHIREANTQLFAMGFYDPLSFPYRTLEEIHGPQLLSEITELTGGQTFPVERLDDLSMIATKIGVELRNQYVLGYKPSNHVYDGRWRKIKVTIRPPHGLPPLLVHARYGYYAKVK